MGKLVSKHFVLYILSCYVKTLEIPVFLAGLL